MADRQDVSNTRDVNHDVPEFSQSLRLSPQRQRPDSGYNTASPANTTSPAPTSTPSRQQHFLFDDVATPTRQGVSPEIFQAAASPREVSPGPALSDSHDTQFHMESDEEEDSAAARRRANNFVGFQLPNLSNESDENADESNEDEEDVFYSHSKILRHWGVASEPQSPRYRSGSLSLRTRRYCMHDDEAHNLGPETVTPITGRPERGRSLRHEVFRGRAVRSHSFSALRGNVIPGLCDASELRRQEESSCRSPGARRTSPRHVTPSPLANISVSHAVSRGHRDDNTGAHDPEESIFRFDMEDINAYHHSHSLGSSPRNLSETDRQDQSPSHSLGFTTREVRSLPHSPSSSNTIVRTRNRSSAPVLTDRPPQSPASRARRRRMGVVSMTTHVRLSCGQLLPCAAVVNPGGQERTVSTQTPHATCTIIQELMSTPAPLPSRARVDSEPAFEAAETLLSRVRVSTLTPWPDGGPENLRSPCCRLAFTQ
ncbi:hypothetical protein PoB_004344700 [Plakobranchus ocellatus]|uniref:Uncharacterized protein n=1 Tax=Plakobranchus ocellatus TaxID=259542 RepID=A0AAV4BBY2_9GAST|nr:hypothetical protein PoB_004344700 [Plakobranchus ocellatus]